LFGIWDLEFGISNCMPMRGKWRMIEHEKGSDAYVSWNNHFIGSA
jgi:hypothetical protein